LSTFDLLKSQYANRIAPGTGSSSVPIAHSEKSTFELLKEQYKPTTNTASIKPSVITVDPALIEAQKISDERKRQALVLSDFNAKAAQNNDYQTLAPGIYVPDSARKRSSENAAFMKSEDIQSEIDKLDAELSNLQTLDSLASRTGEIDGRTREDIQAEIAQKQSELQHKQADWENYAANSGIDPVFGRGLAATASGVESTISGFAGAAATADDWLYDKFLGLTGQKDTDHSKTSYELFKENGGLYGLMFPEADVPSVTDVYKKSQSDLEKAIEGTSGLGKLALEGVQTAANMATTALISYALGIPFTTAMGIQAGGNAALEAKEQGKSIDQQILIGVATGAVVKAVEGLTSIGASKLSQAATSKIATNLLSKLPTTIVNWATTSTGARVVGGILSNGVGEAIEEGIEYPIDVFLQNLILDNDTPFDIKQMGSNMLQGGFVGGVFGGVNVATNSPSGNSTQSQPSSTVVQNGAGGASRANVTQDVNDVYLNDWYGTDGQNNTASTQSNPDKASNQTALLLDTEADGTSAKTNMSEQTEAERTVHNEYVSSVNDELRDLSIQLQYTEPEAGALTLGSVPDRAAAGIQKATGMDTSGFETVIEQSTLKQIINVHGPGGRADHGMSIEDIARMPYVLEHYDAIAIGSSTNPKGSGTASLRLSSDPSQSADVVIFEKKVNGRYYVVEAAPDVNTGTIYIQSAYFSETSVADNVQRLANGNGQAYNGSRLHNEPYEGAGDLLPNVEKVTVDTRKVTEYALNPNNTSGGANKARVFESALGYNQSNSSHLMQQIQVKLPTSKAVLGVADKYGQRFTVDITVTGPNGKTAIVRTGWILEPGSEVPRMTTIYVK